jgi:hypothetical protein
LDVRQQLCVAERDFGVPKPGIRSWQYGEALLG